MAGAGQVQVRLLQIPSATGEVQRLTNLLTEGELQRGNRLLDAKRRDLFFAGRGVLRETLAGYLDLEPREVRLAKGKHGKLRLTDSSGCDLRFNISHAGEWLLVVLAAGREVGCDLEQVRQDLDYRPMAERYFSPREREELLALPVREQLEAFYRCWTRKEAYLKGTGTGFMHPSTGFTVALLPGHPAALLAHDGDAKETARWALDDIAAPAGYCGAIAVDTL